MIPLKNIKLNTLCVCSAIEILLHTKSESVVSSLIYEEISSFLFLVFFFLFFFFFFFFLFFSVGVGGGGGGGWVGVGMGGRQDCHIQTLILQFHAGYNVIKWRGGPDDLLRE